MEISAPSLSKPVIRQYFGPNAHFHAPAIEISFPLPSHRYDINTLIAQLVANDCDIALQTSEAPVDLAEAVGILSYALHTRWTPPEWNSGSENGIGWVCLSHVYPRTTASLLLAVFRTLSEYPSPSAETIQALRQQARWTNETDNVTTLINRAARSRRVSFTPVSVQSKVTQLGQGRHSLQCFGIANERDGLSGFHMSTNKLATIEFLWRMGLPTTHAASAGSQEQALHVARQIGFPCVVKPINQGMGRGITTNIRNATQLASAVRYAQTSGGFPIMVEGQIEGFDHRMLVINGRLLSAYRRTPPNVVGDGASSIRQLIENENQRRMAEKKGANSYLKPILVDQGLSDFLDAQDGLSLDSILRAGQRIYLRGQSNLAQGGTLDNLTRDVHPDNHQLAIQVARLFRVDAMGIDFMTSDIGVSWKETPCAIIEVNCTPGLSGIGDATLALRTLLPNRHSGRIPTFMVIAGPDDGRMLCDAIADLVRNRGLAATIHAPQPTAQAAPTPLGQRVERSLLDPTTEALIIHAPRGELIRNGAPIDICDAIFWPHAEPDSRPTDEAIKRILGHFPEARLTEHLPAREELSSTVGAVLAEFAAGEDDSHPVIELLPGAPDGENGTAGTMRHVRFWRMPAVPSRWMSERLHREGFGAAMDTATGSMLDNHWLSDIFLALANQRLGDAGELALSPTPEVASWSTPFFIRELPPAIVRGSAAEAAARFAADRLNQLIGTYFSAPERP